MLILQLILSVLVLFPEAIYCLKFSSLITTFTTLIDSKIGENRLLNCPINRTNWSLPSIVQWFRAENNFSLPIASQFEDFPVHIDDRYQKRYSLLANGSLQLIDIQLHDNDTFQCRLILIDRGLLDTKEIHSIVLRVNEPPRFLNRSNPLQIARHYSTVHFFCDVYAVPYPTVTWYKVIESKDKQRQTNDKGEDLQQFLTSNQQLTLHKVDDRMAGKYKCLGKNWLGTVQQEFQLLIRGSIYWRQFPSNQTVKMNDSISMKCEGESSEPLQYRWLKDDVFLSDTISSEDRIRTYSDGALIIHRVQPSDQGAYVCMISTHNGTNIRSKPAILTVRYPPLPSQKRPPKNLTLIRGSLGVCPCLLDAYPSIESVSWYRNGRAVRMEYRANGYTLNADHSLVIKSVDMKDNGEYFCRAQNSEGFGRDSLPFYVQVKDPIQFLLKPNASYSVAEGDRLVVPCVAFGRPLPSIMWFKNSVKMDIIDGNLTLERIEKTNHGVYTCQASNPYTITNISTSVLVQDTTPQAPINIRFEQIGSNLFLSWQAGYDGGRSQHFLIWYRLIHKKKQSWKQIRVLPENVTEFLLFDLKLRQTYEITVVAENELGLGTFSAISTVYLNPNQEAPVDYLYLSNRTSPIRPFSPTNLQLSHSGSNLHVSWNHPIQMDYSIHVVYYVLQWRSTTFFNNQYSQQSIVIQYPTRSYTLKGIRQSTYTIQVFAYSSQGTYSKPVEAEITIQFYSLFGYYGSTSILIATLCFLMILTMTAFCMAVILVVRCYHHRRSYWTDLRSANKCTCWCFRSMHYKPGDCSQIHQDRYHANLLKSNELQPSPMYVPRARLISNSATHLARTSSPCTSVAESSISIAKVTTLPRCRDSVASNSTLKDMVIPSTRIYNNPSAVPDETTMTSLFQPITMDHELTHSNGEVETRKHLPRLPLEAVPEMSELNIAHKRASYPSASSSSAPSSNQSQTSQPSPLLITFDSSSMQRHR